MATLSTFLSGLISKSTSFELTDLKTNEVVDVTTTMVKEVNVFFNATLTQNRNEAGLLLTDSKLINSPRVEATVVCDAKGFKKWQLLYSAATDRKTLYNLKVRGLTVHNVMLAQINHEQIADMLNYTKLRLSFNAILLRDSNSYSFLKDGDHSSVFNTIKNEVVKTGKQVKDLIKEMV